MIFASPTPLFSSLFFEMSSYAMETFFQRPFHLLISHLDSFRDSLPYPAPGSGLGERFMDDPDGGAALDRDAHHGGHILPQVLGVLLGRIQWVNPHSHLLRWNIVSIKTVNLKQRGFLGFVFSLTGLRFFSPQGCLSPTLAQNSDQLSSRHVPR